LKKTKNKKNRRKFIYINIIRVTSIMIIVTLTILCILI